MSSVLLFKRHYCGFSANILTCFAFERKSRMGDVDRPWGAALARLLAERRGLTKGTLAELADDMRPGTISSIVKSDKAPEVATIQRLADGFTKWDRKHNHNAPAVPLWEFFVSDQQAALLRASATKHQELISQEELIDRVMTRLTPVVTAALNHEMGVQPVVPVPRVVTARKKR